MTHQISRTILSGAVINVFKEEHGPHINALGKTRLSELQEMVRDWLKTANHDSQVSLTGGTYPAPEHIKLVLQQESITFTGAATIWGIIIDPLFLIKPEDVPVYLKLHITNDPLGRDDPRFISSDYHYQVRQWIQQFLGLKELSMGSGYIQLFMSLLSKPKLFEKAKTYVLAHELCHIIYGDCEAYRQNQLQISTNFISSIIGAATGSGVFGSALVLGSFTYLPAGIVAFGVGFIAFKASQLFMSIRSNHFHEKRADLFAKKMGTGEGGSFLFKTMRELLYHHRQSPASTFFDKIVRQLTIDYQGNPLFEIFEHPLPSTREKYLLATS